MKSGKILTILVLALGFMVWLAGVSEAAPMGTAFTYQGHLYDANDAANGEYDFQFKLFDAPDDEANQVGGDVNKADVDVIDGYFTLELDFGNVFDGNERWLEIGVRPGEMNDPNTYMALSPRQEVTPTPYALQTRGLFVSDAGNLGLGTTSPDRNLDIYHSNTGGGIEIDRVDSTIWSGLVHESAGAEKWFVGMRPDSNNLVLKNKSAGNSIVCEDGTGNVGIGTSTPGFPLTFANSLGDKISLYGQSGDHYGFGIQSSLLQIHTDGSGSDIALGFVSGGTFEETVRFEGNGEVGIGTPNPDRNLDIRHSNTGGGIEIDREDSTIWSGVVYENDGAEKWFIGMQPDSNNLLLKNKAAGSSIVCEDGTGNVGLGTANPAVKLHVNGIVKANGYEGQPYGYAKLDTDGTATSDEIRFGDGSTVSAATSGVVWNDTNKMFDIVQTGVYEVVLYATIASTSSQLVQVRLLHDGAPENVVQPYVHSSVDPVFSGISWVGTVNSGSSIVASIDAVSAGSANFVAGSSLTVKRIN